MRKSSPQLKRFLLRLQRYNVQLNFVPEDQLFVVNILSRLPLLDSTSEIKSDGMNYCVHYIIKSCQISEDRLQEIKKEIQKQDILPDL